MCYWLNGRRLGTNYSNKDNLSSTKRTYVIGHNFSGFWRLCPDPVRIGRNLSGRRVYKGTSRGIKKSFRGISGRAWKTILPGWAIWSIGIVCWNDIFWRATEPERRSRRRLCRRRRRREAATEPTGPPRARLRPVSGRKSCREKEGPTIRKRAVLTASV